MFLKKKIQNYVFESSLDSSACVPLFLSFFSHGVIIALIIGFFASSNSNTHEFIPLTVISSKEFKDLQSKKIISAQKKAGKKQKIIAKNKGQEQSVKPQEIGDESDSKISLNLPQYNSYVNAIANELNRRKSRFSMAKAPNNLKVTVIFKVKLDEKGNLTSYKMAQNSGYEFFDEMAMKILTCRKSFPAPPKEIANQNLEFSIPIIFDSLA